MSNYPKIFSISTVGIRQHDNADFLLHPIRTDFTGDNGLGKSIIADLLQLIFIPMREEWKPGTEGVKKEDRRIETIPLDRAWINHAYSFLNVEVRKNKFLVIGVYIPRNQRSPVRPFIVQKSADFESRKNLVPFDKPLSYSDFLMENQQIQELKSLERNLLDKKEIYFKAFYHQPEIDEYFDLLYRNSLLPINLTIKSNLKSFAKILQSFSRAKTLDINKSNSLQNFLFEDNEEIKFNFDKEKENLAGYIKEYNDHSREINLIEDKQKRLGELKTSFAKYEEAKIDYYKNNALFISDKHLKAKKAFEDNQTQQLETQKKYSNTKKEFDEKTVELYKALLEQQEICNQIRKKLEVKKAEASKENIDTLRSDLRKSQSKVEKLEELKTLVDRWKSVEEIENKLHEQDKTKEQLKKLNLLKGIKLYNEFEKSDWTRYFKETYEKQTARKNEINFRLPELKELLELYKGNNPDSLFNWALNRKQALTLAEETVLMNFKNIFIKQVEANKGAKYTLTPKSLLSAYEEESNGLWLKLGELREFIPFIEKQIFDNASKLSKAIEKDKKEIEEEINSLTNELQLLTSLHSQLQHIGYNQEFVEIYQNRKELEKFVANKLLSEDNLNFIKTNFHDFENIKDIKAKNKTSQEHIDQIVIDRNNIQEKLTDNKRILDKVLIQIGRIPEEAKRKPVETETESFGKLEVEELKTKQQDYVDSIQTLSDDRSAADRKKIGYDGELTSLANAKPTLKADNEKYEKLFSDAKKKLHDETDLKFDGLMSLGNLTDDSIQLLKDAFETNEKAYQFGFISVAEIFEDTKQAKKHPEIYLADGNPNFSFPVLVNVLCGKLGLDGLTPELTRLNEKRKDFADLQLGILINVFEQVEKQYNEYDSTIRRLNLFFNQNKVSKVYKFKIEFTPRTDIGIDWIERMRTKAKVQKYGHDLFSQEVETTPENFIKSIATTFYHSIDCDPSDLLNPKFYFNLNVRMENEQGKTNAGSGGQAYTALALLCIGRLSIVQKVQDKPGIRFVIIEELSNIDDNNFNIFPQIANEFGYQLLTMTPKPFGSYTNEEWYLHMLVGGTEPDWNYTAMSFFKNKYDEVELTQYLARKNELESSKTS